MRPAVGQAILRIVADDLTGALDAAAPFATRTGPLPVFWREDRLDGQAGSFALATGSRDAAPGSRVDGWWRHFAGADLAYKKIDSLLRARTTDEVAACLQSGLFQSAVIAPAFPAQQRITRAGRQLWRSAPDEPWQPVERDLLAELERRGLAVRQASSPGDLCGRGILFCDALSEQDLRAIAEAGSRLEPPVLWCGSAGLARALAGSAARSPPPGLCAPCLILVGSHHPLARRQVDTLAARRPELLVRLRSAGRAALACALERLDRTLEAESVAVLVFAFPDATLPVTAGQAISRAFGDLARRPDRPASLVVTGGDTLLRLMQAIDARCLRVEGELAPGIACSTIDAGPWQGMRVISKSGAFGDPQVLIGLAESAMAWS